MDKKKTDKLKISEVRNEFAKYLLKHTSLSENIIDVIVDSNIIHYFEKGTVLLREGDLSNECYLVFKGCIRSYLIKNGDERTIEFYTEEQPVLPICFGKKIPSEHYLECIEDTIACVSTPENEKEMFQKYPLLESACRIMAETMMTKYQVSLIDYLTTSAEDRYLKLLQDRPELIQRVPQYQLASYLGIKPESLSRIRRRLNKR